MSLIKKLLDKLRMNFLNFLQVNIYSNDGIFKKYFYGRRSQSNIIGRELLLTSLISFDFHKTIVLLSIGITLALTSIFNGQILIILQSILAACIFDYISNILMKEYQKNILSFEIAETLRNIDNRIKNIKKQIGIPYEISVDHKNLPDISKIDFKIDAGASVMILVSNDEREAFLQQEKTLNRKMTKNDYISFLHQNNIKDIELLLNSKNIDVCPNLYKALICAYRYRSGYVSNINEFVNVFITNFDRISFWSKMELGIYTPQILNMGTTFEKDNILEYTLFGSIIISSNNSQIKNKHNKKDYKKILNTLLKNTEKLLLLLSVFWLIKSSSLPLITGMPQFINTLFTNSKDNLFITGGSVGILLIYMINKLTYLINKIIVSDGFLR